MKPYLVDLAVLVIILWELLMGLRRGLSGELFRLFGTGLVLLTALRFYEDFGLLIAQHSRLAQNQEMALALAFLLIMAGLSLCLFLLRIVLHLLVNVKFNDAFDRPAGALAGIMRGLLLAGLLVLAAGLWPNETLRPMIMSDSRVGRTVFKLAPLVKEKLRSLEIRFQAPPAPPAPAPAAPEPAGHSQPAAAPL